VAARPAPVSDVAVRVSCRFGSGSTLVYYAFRYHPKERRAHIRDHLVAGHLAYFGIREPESKDDAKKAEKKKQEKNNEILGRENDMKKRLSIHQGMRAFDKARHKILIGVSSVLAQMPPAVSASGVSI
jgi:hypothetical protein